MNGNLVWRLKNSSRGFSIVELLTVVAIMSIIAGISLPQIISARRILQFNGLSREISSQLRFARQQAMSQRQVFRFRYDDSSKKILIIDNEEAGTPADPIAGTPANPLGNNPNNDVIVKTTALASTGVPASEIRYDRPAGAPATLPDGTTRTAPVANLVEIIFQPDGSVQDANGNPVNQALFFYDTQAPGDTAMAVSVLGAGGRVKVWKYNKNANSYIN